MPVLVEIKNIPEQKQGTCLRNKHIYNKGGLLKKIFVVVVHDSAVAKGM